MDKKLFSSVWESFAEIGSPTPVILDDAFTDTILNNNQIYELKGFTIFLKNKIALTVWEDGTAKICNFE